MTTATQCDPVAEFCSPCGTHSRMKTTNLRCSTECHRFRWKAMCATAVDTFSENTECATRVVNLFLFWQQQLARQQPLRRCITHFQWKLHRMLRQKYLLDVHKTNRRWWKERELKSTQIVSAEPPISEHLCHLICQFLLSSVTIFCSTVATLHVFSSCGMRWSWTLATLYRHIEFMNKNDFFMDLAANARGEHLNRITNCDSNFGPIMRIDVWLVLARQSTMHE